MADREKLQEAFYREMQISDARHNGGIISTCIESAPMTTALETQIQVLTCKSQKVFLHENKRMFVPTCSQVQLAPGYVANTACRSRIVHAV